MFERSNDMKDAIVQEATEFSDEQPGDRRGPVPIHIMRSVGYPVSGEGNGDQFVQPSRIMEWAELYGT